MPSGNVLLRERALESDCGRGRVTRTREGGERAVTFALRARHPTAVRFRDLGRELVMPRDDLRHGLRVRLPERVEPWMSVSTNVTTPVGSAISRAPCSRSTSSDAVAGPSGRVGIQRTAQHAVETLGELGLRRRPTRSGHAGLRLRSR